jgi:hypothetical protein
MMGDGGSPANDRLNGGEQAAPRGEPATPGFNTNALTIHGLSRC